MHMVGTRIELPRIDLSVVGGNARQASANLYKMNMKSTQSQRTRRYLFPEPYV